MLGKFQRLFFTSLYQYPVSVNVREVATREFSLNHYDARDFPDKDVLVGEADGFGLRLYNPEHETGLWVCSSLRGAIIANTSADTIATLTAGNRRTGVWGFGLGEQTEQTLWFRLNSMHVDAQEICAIGEVFKLCGRVAARGSALLESGVFETSTFFKGDIE